MKLYFKLKLVILILIAIIFFYRGFYNNVFLETDDFDNYNLNFISKFNSLNPQHWLILLSNENYNNLRLTLHNALILSKNDNKKLGVYYLIKNFQNLKIEEQNKLIYFISE